MDKDPSPPPEPELQLEKLQAENTHAKFRPVVGIGLLLLMAAAYGGSKSFSVPASPPLVKAHGDNIDESTRASLESQFMTYTGKLQIADLSDDKTKKEFLASPLLHPEIKQKIMADASAGKQEIGTISVWDNFDEDGDAIRITSGDFSVDVPLFHAPTRIFIPFKKGDSLTITGLHDGGGGITAAIQTSAGAVPLPLLAVGQTIVLPVF